MVPRRSARQHSRRLRASARWTLLFALVAVLPGALPAGAIDVPPPPATRTEAVVDTLHGVPVADPYRWLEDQEAPEVRAWIAAQHARTRFVLDQIPGRERVVRRLEGLVKIDRFEPPTARGGRYFFARRLAGQEQFTICLREGAKGRDEVLVDPYSLSPDHTVSVELRDVSQDGKVMAYDLRAGGADETTIHLLDVNRRRELPDSLPSAVYFGFSLTSDLKDAYYTRRMPEGPRVFHHVMGTDPAGDRLIFGEGLGPEKIVESVISENGRWLLITVMEGSSGEKTEIYFQDLLRGGPITPLVNDIRARFYGSDGGNTLYLRTDWEAPNYRVLAADLEQPAREHWREVAPASEEVIDTVATVGGRLCLNVLSNVQSSVKIYQPDGRLVRRLEFPSIGTVSAMAGRWADNELFVQFSSFHIPLTIYRYDLAKGTRETWASPTVALDTDGLQMEQVWYTSRDGTRIPMFILHAKNLVRDGSHPVLLYGYGGFSMSFTPRFSPRALTWVLEGGVYALPSLRGGGEFGEAWHEAAMLEKKQNTFDDFYAAAEYLIAQGYTRPEHLGMVGGSNGGLLVGAALTQRPELCGAVVCSYPLLDMVRFHKFLMGPYWVSEYGSADSADQFPFIYAYSPYQHVKPGVRYPGVLFMTGDSDTRVAPLHARKMAALMQAVAGSDRPMLLHYRTGEGHAGGTPASVQIEDTADEILFLRWQLGVAD